MNQRYQLRLTEDEDIKINLRNIIRQMQLTRQVGGERFGDKRRRDSENCLNLDRGIAHVGLRITLELALWIIESMLVASEDPQSWGADAQVFVVQRCSYPQCKRDSDHFTAKSEETKSWSEVVIRLLWYILRPPNTYQINQDNSKFRIRDYLIGSLNLFSPCVRLSRIEADRDNANPDYYRSANGTRKRDNELPNSHHGSFRLTFTLNIVQVR